MKIAIVSDMHRSHWVSHHLSRWMEHVESCRSVLEAEAPELLVDAGDCECDVRELLGWKGSFLSVKGNHDWYGRSFEPSKRFVGAGIKRDTSVFMSSSDLVLGCTLWTDLNRADGHTMYIVNRCLNDAVWIDGFSAEEALAEHRADVDWLRRYRPEVNAANPTVVVTHHAPSFKSVHPRFKDCATGNEFLINYGFASELDHLVEELSPKLWVHGHMHDPVDYQIGRTRVVANPMGYPHERRGRPHYTPLVLEV